MNISRSRYDKILLIQLNAIDNILNTFEVFTFNPVGLFQMYVSSLVIFVNCRQIRYKA